jgi:hypothetical protein
MPDPLVFLSTPVGGRAAGLFETLMSAVIRNSESRTRKQDLESHRVNQVSFEEGALADVAPDHLLGFVPGVLHDVAFVGAGRRRGRETGTERCTSLTGDLEILFDWRTPALPI